jgi:ABC-type transport system involved in multi-copper enzyme maturation permease subunit
MTPVLALFTMSLRQALPRRRTLLLGLLELTPAAVYLVSTTNRTEQLALQGATQVGGSILFSLVLPVVAIVTAAGVLGSERRDQTLSFIALRPIPRLAIAGAKVAAAIGAAFALNAIGAIALATSHAIRFGDAQLFVGLVVGVFIATAAYAAVFVPLGFLTDRAVIVGMAYLLVFENGIAYALPGLASLSPWRLGMAAFGALATDAAIYTKDFTGSLELSVAQSASTAILFLVLGITATTILLRTRDLT